MNSFFSRKTSRAALWLAAAAVLFAALSPLANAMRAQGEPKLFAEICTSVGFVKIAADGSRIPATPDKHAPQCAWCLASATWLALTGATEIAAAAPKGRYVTPESTTPSYSPRRTHVYAWAQAPPQLS